MIINPNIEIAIQKHIQNRFDKCETCKIKDLLQNYSGFVKVTKAELINTINNSLRAGNLNIIDEKAPWEDSTVISANPFPLTDIIDNISIVISKPRLRELSLGNIEERNKQVDSIDCFREIIVSAKDVLRICSPFIQKNVLSDDSFPELRKLLIDALKRNVEIRLLSRELFQGRDKEIQWVIDIADDLGKNDNLRVVDYHLSMEDGTILSSTHAKLIIADYAMAYVGSAELRRNSLVTNLEVGCLVRGSQVFGICEVFDFMFSHGRIWK
jgi:hypothetical protein